MHLTKADVEFKWETPQVEAFQELKRHLETPSIHAYFYEEADTKIHSDANSAGLGAVLVQRTNGLERVISYTSWSLSKTEANHSTTMPCYHQGYIKVFSRPFKVVSDHRAMCWLVNLKAPSGHLAQWRL